MNLLFVANFPPGVGYAWNTIEEVFRRIALRWATDGGTVFVAYPPGDGSSSPTVFRDSDVRVIEFDYRRVEAGVSGTLAFADLIRRHRIKVLYLTDKPSWAWAFPVLHAAGVERIVVHDRTSGDRSPRPGFAGVLKRAWHRIPGFSADVVIGVSRFVADRMLASGTLPERTVVVYNGIDLERFAHAAAGGLANAVGQPAATPVIFASGRAHEYKGISTLIRAAALVERRTPAPVHFAYVGDGPAMGDFRRLVQDLGVSNFSFLGRRSDIPTLLGSAAIAVVPSHWAEAFGLAVAEAMAAGVPVIATTVGGIPELVEHDVDGILIPPADAEALATAILGLLADPERRARLGRAGRTTARRRFAIDRVVAELYALVRPHPAQGISSPR